MYVLHLYHMRNDLGKFNKTATTTSSETQGFKGEGDGEETGSEKCYCFTVTIVFNL